MVSIAALHPAFHALMGALIWGFWRYVRHYRKNGERFDATRFVSTIIVAGIMGLTFSVLNVYGYDPLASTPIGASVGAYVAVVGAVDNALSELLSGTSWDVWYNGERAKATQEAAELGNAILTAAQDGSIDLSEISNLQSEGREVYDAFETAYGAERAGAETRSSRDSFPFKSN